MDTYAIVTEKIVNLLEQGIVPWRRPWASTGLPRNLVSKKPYRGVNLFLLSATKYISPFWLTMKQANELGGTVRKGEHSQIVVFWKVDQIASAATQTDPNSDQADTKSRRRFVLKYYRLFNLEQCELPQSVLEKLPKIEMRQHDPIEACEKILANMPNPPEIVHAGDKAFYSPISDRVTMPPRGLFENAEEYWSTFWHECGGHATGHPKRLNRSSISEAAPFGSPMYSFEELIAECSAAYLCAEAGISPAVIDNQAAYIQGWLTTLRSNRRMVVVAAAQAQKAADYVLNRESTAE
jgi:antirestriction protein ArdC